MILHKKVQLLDMLQEGKSYVAVRRYYVVNESTVYYIKKDKLAIRTTVAVKFSESAKKITIGRNKHSVRNGFCLIDL